MSEPIVTSPQNVQAARPLMPLIVYVLYLVSIPLPFLTAIIGVVIAYVLRGEGPDWAESHFRHQIHLFWKFLLYLVIGLVTSVILIGFVIAFVAYIWLIVRCIMGIRHAYRGDFYPRPAAWLG
jgi:uncharacterized membrane protein